MSSLASPISLTVSDPSLRSEHSAPSRTPSLIILGTDALLAARPAVPVQLAHACLALGYDGVVPASWGDELVADAAMQRVLEHDHGPAVLCSCPHVARRMLQAGSDLQPFLLSLVAPPVAAARYLRALWAPTPIGLTFVGHCPGASDDAIDARISPRELLSIIEARGIVLAEQPQVFEEVIPPDRRRFHSRPGGAPSSERLRERCGRELVELRGRELTMELAQYLLTESDVVLDVAASLGCACTGASVCATPWEAQRALAAIEPPRAASPVLTALATPLSLDQPLPSTPLPPARVDGHERAVVVASPPSTPPASGAPGEAESSSEDENEDESEDVVRITRTGRVVERASDHPSEPETELETESAAAADVPSPASAAPPRRPPILRRRPGSRPRHPALSAHFRRQQEASPASHTTPTPPGEPADDDAAMSASVPGDSAPSEMEQLRETVERALAPFFANVEASSEVAEVEPAVVSRPRAAPVAPRSPSPEPRRSDVATPITIAYEPDVAVSREPEVVAREPMIPRDAPDEARELGAMAAAPVRATPRESRSLKSVAAQTVAIPPGSIPRAARPPEAAPRRDVRVVTPVAARRKLAVATGITVAVLAAASAALYFLGYADRAIGVLTSVVR